MDASAAVPKLSDSDGGHLREAAARSNRGASIVEGSWSGLRIATGCLDEEAARPRERSADRPCISSQTGLDDAKMLQVPVAAEE